jgi:glutamate 5-kinase
VAQILVTGKDIDNAEHCENIENTINRLLELGALPIINENDTVSVDEIDQVKTLGDNDTLAAIVASCIKADLLILLSDIDGLYTDNPRENPNASLISVVYELNEKILSSAGKEGSSLGTGGMKTKLSAAKIVCEKGIDMVIANGSNPEKLYDIVEGKSVGTRFLSNKQINL